ncbi:MAG: transcription antitermination protein NusB [Candidatus Absconditicoccaceae bacterium]
MNVHNRINARKIVLSYFYQVCFFSKLLTQDFAIKEALFIDNTFESQTEKFSQERELFLNLIKEEYLSGESEEDLMYVLNRFFDEWKTEDVDIDYVLKVGNNFNKHKDELISKVNGYAQSFDYDQMDVIDQALFILGYVERKELDTPKEVVLNELVELAKRYCDEGSPKLINGIMHNIISEGK